MIQQKQSQFEQRFNKLNENKQNIIPRVKKEPLPIVNQEKRQTKAKFNKLYNGSNNNPQYIQRNRMQLPDLYVQSAQKYSQSAEKYKLQSRIPSQLQQHLQRQKQKQFPNGIKKHTSNKINNKFQPLSLPQRYKQEQQIIPTKDGLQYQKEQIHNNRQSKQLKRRCCHENQTENSQQAQCLRRHKSCSEQQIMNKLKMRKLQPLKFSIRNKMDFNNIVSSAPQHQMNLRAKRDKVLSKNQQKELAQKLSKPKQFFHKCDKRFCECSKRHNELLDQLSRNSIMNKNNLNGQQEDNFNLRMKKTRRMIKLKPLKTQPTTIEVEQLKPIVHYQNNHQNNQLIQRQYSEIDILNQSSGQMKVIKSRRTLENAILHQEGQNQHQKEKEKEKRKRHQSQSKSQEKHKKVQAKQIEVQTDQAYQEYLLEKQLITSQRKQSQPLSKKSISQKQRINIGNSSYIQSQQHISAHQSRVNDLDYKGKSNKVSRTKIKIQGSGQVQEVSSKSLTKSNASKKNEKIHKLSEKNLTILNQQKKKSQKQEKQKEEEEQKQKQSEIKKQKISKKLHNSHQYDFVIELKTSKEQKFKNELLKHLNNQQQQQKNSQMMANVKNQVSSKTKTNQIQIQPQTDDNKFSLQDAKLENTAHFKQIQKEDISKLHTFNLNQNKNQNQKKKKKTHQNQNIDQIPIELGLLTASKNNREDSPNSKLQDSFIRLSEAKSNKSSSKKKSLNQFNKHSSISKASKNHIIFRVPKEEQFLDFIKKYKCLNSQFDLKSLIVQENFHAKSYKEGFYFGQIENDKPHGRGVLLTQRELFQGTFQNQNKVKGFQKTSDGIYEGDFFNNLRHGQGKFIWNNGQIFEGQWRLGTKNGYGKWEAPDGSNYVGEWSLNNQHGKGKFVHPTSTYEGDFQKFLKHGKGIETFPNGDRYQGQYHSGKPNGFGKYVWGDGAYYEGTFVNGLRQGTGKWHQNSDTLYQGQFFQDQKHGHGIQFYKNGNYFQGEFHNGIIKKGTLFDPYKKEIKRSAKEDHSF